jgi:hypothetical protein
MCFRLIQLVSAARAAGRQCMFTKHQLKSTIKAYAELAAWAVVIASVDYFSADRAFLTQAFV